MALRVFISYASQQADSARTISAALFAAGMANSLGWRGDDDRASSNSDIDAALAGVDVFLLLRSAAADSSRQVIGELQRAKARGLRVATVRLEPLAASGPLVDGLQQLVMLDAFPPLANHLASIVSALKSLPNAPTAPSGAAIADTTWSGSIGPPAPSVAGPAPIADTMWQGEPQSIGGATPQSQIPHPAAPAAASGTPIADTHWSGTVPPVKSVAGPAPVADTMWKGEPQSIEGTPADLSMAQWPVKPAAQPPAPPSAKSLAPPPSPGEEATLPFDGPPPAMNPLPPLPSTGLFDPPSGPPPAPSALSDGIDELRQHGSIDAPPRPGILGKIGHFELIRKLGEGGMGIVLLARNTRNDSLVAMKTMRPRYAASAQARHRFVVEARHMERMNHPNVLKVLEVCDSPQACYYTMPLVSGGSLATQMGSGDPMFPDTVVRIGRQVADALRYAHDQAGVIHRDIKPQNVLMDAGGHALLSDFGLVRTLFNDTVIDDQPRSWTVGTGPYMPPEIVAGNAGDTRADIYSFGAMLYEMACGKSPYNGQSTEEVLTKIKLGPPPPIMQVNPAVPPALVKVIEGCMGRELRDRYAHMADVAEDLRRVQIGQEPLGPHGVAPRSPAAGTAGHTAPAPPASPRRSSSRLPVGIAAVALVGLIVAAVVMKWKSPGGRETKGDGGGIHIDSVGDAHPAIAVIPFKIDCDLADQGAGQTLAEAVGAEADTNRFTLRERLDLSAPLQEKRLQSSDLFDQSGEAAGLGQDQHVRYLVLGRLSRLGGYFYLNAKLIDCNNGQIVRQSSVHFESMANAASEIPELARGLGLASGGAVVARQDGGTLSTSVNPHQKFLVKITSDKPNYVGGDHAVLTVTADRDCYIHLITWDSAGGTVLLPNPYRGGDQTFLHAGEARSIPSPPRDDFVFPIGPPYGATTVRVIATTDKVDLKGATEFDLKAAGTFVALAEGEKGISVAAAGGEDANVSAQRPWTTLDQLDKTTWATVDITFDTSAPGTAPSTAPVPQTPSK